MLDDVKEVIWIDNRLCGIQLQLFKSSLVIKFIPYWDFNKKVINLKPPTIEESSDDEL